MVWVSGRLVSEAWNRQGHQWTDHGGGKISVRIDRSIASIEPGPAVPITVSLWEKADNHGRYLETTANVTGTPSPFILPTVPSGQVIGPRVIREMFTLRPADVDSDGILSDIQGRLSHLSVGIHCSPGDQPAWDTFEKWKAAHDSICKQPTERAKELGFRIVGIGDDFWRNEAERQATHTLPFREQMIRHTAAYYRDLGICDVVRMVDEVGGDPEFYAPEEFLGWWRDEGGPPIAWASIYPVLWEGNLSDLTWRYWRDAEWRPGRKGMALTTWQMWQAIKRSYQDVPLFRQWFGEVAGTGDYYQKKVPGSEYQLGDELLKGGVRASDIIAQSYLLLGLGSTGIGGFYAYDYDEWRNKRANQVPGTIDPDGIQTGTRPGDARWAGIEALTAVAAHEADLVDGMPYSPVESGPWVFCRRGSLIWGVNTGESPLVSPNGPGIVVGNPTLSFDSTVPAGGVILWK